MKHLKLKNSTGTKKLLLQSPQRFAPTILRTFLGGVLFAHGAQKLPGWFGGYGYDGTMQFFTQTIGLPYALGLLVIFIEFFGALALILGLGTRIIAVLVTGLMMGIIFTSHLQNGFFMNWFGNQKGEGYEYFILVIAMALSLVITGAGNWSLDGSIVKILARKKSQAVENHARLVHS